MSTPTVDPLVDRADIIEALLHHNATAMRCPRHWTDRLANLHHKMNDLLDDLDQLEADGG